jgi:hypothetical protein
MLWKIPPIRELLTNELGPGLVLERRENNWNGTVHPLSFIARYLKMDSLPMTYVNDEYLGMTPAYQYTVEIENFIPIARWEEEPIRFGTLAFWHLSHVERLRQTKRMDTTILPDPVFKKAVEIAESMAAEILTAYRDYIQNIIDFSDLSYEQWMRYVKGHEISSLPIKIGGRKIHYHDLLDNDALSQRVWHSINTWIRTELPKLVEWFDKEIKWVEGGHKPHRVYVRPDFSNPALRSREGEGELLQKSDTRALYRVTKYRDRPAGGIEGYSQMEYGIWETENKIKAYAPIYAFTEKYIGITSLHFIEKEGTEFYLNMIKQVVQCYDIANADKQVGACLYFLPFNVDLNWPACTKDAAAVMYSGISPTRPLNITYLTVLVIALRELGLEIKPITIGFMGGDNFAIDGELDMEQLKNLISNDERCLGFNPDLRRFYGYHATKDNQKDRIPISKRKLAAHPLIMQQRRQQTLRVLMGVLYYDMYATGDCVKFLDWVKDKDLALQEILSRHDIEEAILGYLVDREAARFFEEFKSTFSEQIEWIEYSFNTVDTPTFVTDFQHNLS